MSAAPTLRTPRGREFEYIESDKEDLVAAIAEVGDPRTAEQAAEVERVAREKKRARMAREALV
jgi:hypothetical protein